METEVLDTIPISLRWAKPLHKISIIGVMGSGKTTLAMRFYLHFRRGRREVTSVYFQYDKDKKEELWETLRNLEARHVCLVIDDLSFTLDRPFMQALTRVRHLNPAVSRWCLIVNMHYSKAVLPFLRYSHTKVLTSLTDPEEIENLRWNFTTQALWDYYWLYSANPDAHYILMNWRGRIFISWFKKPARKCWDIVVSGPECIR